MRLTGKSAWFLVLCLLAATPLLAGDKAPAAKAAKGLTKLSESVYTYEHVHSGSPGNAFGANAGVVIGKDAVLVVDTMTSAKEAKKLLRDIRAVTNKPIRYVVNTHYHLDHSLGNCVFSALGARIIAHESGRTAFMESLGKGLPDPKVFSLPPDFFAGTTPVIPDITFATEMEVDLGGLTVKLVYPGAPSHSPDSILVIVPAERIVFTGDILFTDFHPYLGEADLAGWAAALGKVKTLDAILIVPGHGPLSSTRDVDALAAYLPAFDAMAKELAATSSDPKAIAEEMLRRLPQRQDGAFIVGMNVSMRYLKKQ